MSDATAPPPDETEPADVDLDRLAEVYNAGLEAEKAGDIPAAVRAFRAALALDPEDRGGVSVRLAALGQAEAPANAPPAYVAMLFDQTAERFDDILVEQLGYHVPMMLRGLLRDAGVLRAERLLDLGCGTGLAGASLRDIAGHITGCDLSEGMLDQAHERGCYDDLYIAEAIAFLESWDEAPFDLIVATDMVPYCGDLGPLLSGAAACLRPGGHLAFSTETLPEAAFAGRAWMVGPKQRYAHAQGPLGAALARAGLTVLTADPITVRHDEGEPVAGYLILVRREPVGPENPS